MANPWEKYQTASGPWNKYSQKKEFQKDNSSIVGDIVSGAIKNTPLGMASSGAGSLSKGVDAVGTLLSDVGAIDIPKSVQSKIAIPFNASRAIGVGTALKGVGVDPTLTTQRTVEAFNSNYKPQGIVENVGATAGEMAPVVAANYFGPEAGSAAYAAQQAAREGKVGPAPLALGFSKQASPILKPISKFAGDTGARMGSLLSGNQVDDIKSLFNKPKAFFAKPMSKAQEIYGKAEDKLAPSSILSDEEAFDSARTIALKNIEKLKDGTGGPLEAHEARMALDDLIEKSKSNQRVKRLKELRNNVDSIVKSNADLAAADEIYSNSALASNFRKLFPVNKGGTASYIRSLLTGGAAVSSGSVLPFIATSPLTVGTATAGLGALNKIPKRGLSQVIQAGGLSDKAKTSLGSTNSLFPLTGEGVKGQVVGNGLDNKQENSQSDISQNNLPNKGNHLKPIIQKPSKKLTKEKAIELLAESNDNIELARKKAKELGYIW